MTNTYEAVIFDFDGLMVNSEQHWEKALRRVFQEYGGVFPPTDVHAGAIGGGHIDAMSQFVKSGYISGDVGELAEKWISNLIGLTDTEPPVPMQGIDEILCACNFLGYQTAVASNSPRAYVEHVLRNIRIYDVFQVLATGDEVSTVKPSPDIYLLAAHRLGIAPKNCAALEDSRNGVLAAKAAGMTVIAVPYRKYYRHIEEADYNVPTLSEASEIITKLRIRS